MKINVGCGGWPLEGFVNVDRSANSRADVIADALALPFADGSAAEVYAGHFLEHLEPADADRFLAECLRVLEPGGRLGVVVPDMRAVLARYVNGPALQVEFIEPSGRHFLSTADLDDVCAGFIYSTLQESGHRWCYDETTLRRRLTQAGLVDLEPINRWFDPHIPVGAWYQCGWYGRKPCSSPTGQNQTGGTQSC